MAKRKKLSQMMADSTVVYGDKFGDIGGEPGDRIRRGGSGIVPPDPKTTRNRRKGRRSR